MDLSLPFQKGKARVVEDFERAYMAGLLAAHGKLTVATEHADMDLKNFSDQIVRSGLRRGGGEETADHGSGAT